MIISNGQNECSLCVLGSGSQGNSIYFRAGNMHCLIDAGMSYKEIQRRLQVVGVAIENIQYIFITHEHADHISALKTLTRKQPVCLFATPKTYLQIAHLIHAQTELCLQTEETSIHGLTICPFPISHDSVDPVGYSFYYQGTKVSVVTDLGTATEDVVRTASGSQALVVECNHDEQMLWNGTYSDLLKHRIAGNKGHLSNRQTADLIGRLLHDQLHYVFLAHLSRENNKPNLAFKMINDYLITNGMKKTRLFLTSQFETSALVQL